MRELISKYLRMFWSWWHRHRPPQNSDELMKWVEGRGPDQFRYPTYPSGAKVRDVFRVSGYVYFVVSVYEVAEAYYDIIRYGNQSKDSRLGVLWVDDSQQDWESMQVKLHSYCNHHFPTSLRKPTTPIRLQQKLIDCWNNAAASKLGPHPSAYLFLQQPAFGRQTVEYDIPEHELPSSEKNGTTTSSYTAKF